MTTAPPAGAAPPAPFELYGPLPAGTTLLEASAGTGKTYAIATLTARFVAAGTPLERILVITFTRMATGELRARVRDRLRSARHGLDRALTAGSGHPAGDGRTSDADELVAHLLADGTAAAVERRDRLARALAQFDAATIETTHGFCHRVLAELGVAGDGGRSLAIVDDVGGLVEEVVDDLYVRKYLRNGTPDLTRAAALELALQVVRNPSAALAPPLGDGADVASVRRRLGEAVRNEMARRKRQSGILTYDDVLVRLRDTLAHERRGGPACARLRSRYEVVLIDEFQDTDPVQWEIVQRAFGSGGALVLIGDPKQAIYAFRGADVQAYLAAARTASTLATLATNWRSDGPLVRGLDALLLGAQLGDANIVYRTVAAAARNDVARLTGAPVEAAVRIRHLPRRAVARTSLGDAVTDAARRFVADDLAADVAALLSSDAKVEAEARRDDRPARLEPVQPGHVAVLVRRNADALLVQRALAARGVPAVVVAPGSVFSTSPAGEWLRLLEALEQPTSPSRAAAAALTCFLGWDARRLAMAADDDLDQLHGRLHEWAGALRDRGVASLLAAVETATGLPARLLGSAGGERQLTDLHHVGELLHAEASADSLGPAALATWLRARIVEADGPATSEASAEERSRRLESDAEAVQVLTIHRSKGLEFPVVYCPFLWHGSAGKERFPIYHDAANGGARTLDVGGERSGFSAPLQLALAEQLGEDLRLCYVALTRARHQVVCWWAPTKDAGRSPLGRLLFAREPDGAVGTGGRTPDDDTVSARLQALAQAAPGCVAVEDATPLLATYRPPGDTSDALALATLHRRLDTVWRRLSYSSLTAPAHVAATHDAATHDAEAGDGQLDDEAGSGLLPAPGGVDGDGDGDGARLRSIPAALDQAPGGTDFGTLVHALLEQTDFAAPDLRGELRAALDAGLAWQRVEVGGRAQLVDDLAAVLATPLGPGLGELRLDQLDRANRLDELAFELPLVGGDRPHGALQLAGLGELLGTLLPAGDPVAAYAPRLSEPAIQASLRGYLNGSLDLVLRTPDGRYAVCDYKTNRLAPAGDRLTAYDYRPAVLDAEMARSHYPLQALFYLVALHRYLRWRLPSYDPSRHLAGAHYLFVRGMTGDPEARVGGQPCGVWSWSPPPAVLEATSDLLDEGAPR
ncbi:MAG: UvrD-helicase domain-containing protein [Actinomycetota bacterium]|nr:UvrD-helicase domain-containing protein [Actinomycetota bacterium]